MSFNISSIVIYSYNGDQRVLKFNTSGLNVLTGESRTGKSSIIDIIDYCFGRGECYVAEGVIRQHVSWFAVELQKGEDVLFIARRNPGPTQNTSPDIYIRRGEFSNPPLYTELVKNIAEEGLIPLLSQFAGISETEHRPISGTRLPLKATIKHSMFLCIQNQNEIDSRDRLFHRQADQFIPQAIKDTIPYFLGAVDETHFIKQAKLDVARQELRNLENQVYSRKQAVENSIQRVRRFINDAKRVGIIETTFESTEVPVLITALRRATEVNAEFSTSISDSGETILRLQDDQKGLRERLTTIVEEIRATSVFLSEQSSYSREASEQQSRLKSIGLYKKDDNGEVCPICNVSHPVPIPSAKEINLSLERIERNLDRVGLENPHLQNQLKDLAERKSKLELSLVENQDALHQAYIADARASRQRELVVERARVIGRISVFLEQAGDNSGDEDLSEQIEIALHKVKALEEDINADGIGQRLDTFINLISLKMSDYARRLELEHGSSSVRLDLKKLTVVADTPRGPIPLSKMGSGENWIGYHVLTHLALHHWYRTQNRPVPGFLIFDQPSQAHYPPDRNINADGKLDVLKDTDQQAVHNLFKLMSEASSEIGEDFQLIVLDHARLAEPWFDRAVVEEWREGEYLVPHEWIH